MSLADEFLADLEDDNNEEDIETLLKEAKNINKDEIREIGGEKAKIDILNKKSIKYITNLIGSDRLNKIIEAISDSRYFLL